MSSLRLGVNVDHVATLRQARYATMPESKNAEPDLLVAARICERAGAGGIVAHLRSDRRHIQDHDIERLRQNIMTKLNLEMGNTEEIIDVALRILPDEVCLVPEKREEITTEGGLDVIAQRKELEPTIKRLQVAGIRVSLFIDPTLEQVDVAAELGVEMVELHTGRLANAFTEKIQKEELEQLRAAARAASESHLQVNAGHGINYKNIALIHQIPCLRRTQYRPRNRIARDVGWLGKRRQGDARRNGKLSRMNVRAYWIRLALAVRTQPSPRPLPWKGEAKENASDIVTTLHRFARESFRSCIGSVNDSTIQNSTI